ncbi:serine hydrolase [Pseudoprimorskyibacter insulae]
MLIVLPLSVAAATYAAFVMDARTGEVLHASNADARLHPASLTKMMTLYVAFEAVQNGEISMDTMVRVSRMAANEEPSRLGLKAGQRIKLRYLVRAAAVKSANDAATAIGEAISGSEAAFARRMNRTAKAMGMTRTTFKNANGLTESGHLSTARDMSILGRHLIYDYPQYYNLFQRRTADAGVRTVSHTNRRLLDSYPGADGIKTGYTRAAGFNLVASAERGNERIIATVFGGRSTASRDARVKELLDMGFKRAPSSVSVQAPGKPAYSGNVAAKIETADPRAGTRAKSIRVASAAVTRSLRPVARPGSGSTPAQPLLLAEVDQDSLQELLREAQDTALPKDAVLASAEVPSTKPAMRPEHISQAAREVAEIAEVEPAVAEPEELEVVERVSTSGGRHWGINIGRFPTKFHAQKAILKTALTEMASLEGSLRKIVDRPNGYDANFMGLTRDSADLACRRLQARQMACFMIGPSS